MAINATHAEYDASAGAWSRARDVIAGEDAIKAAGERYLPRLECQTEEEYAAYKERAAFFNATARTADGYLGLLFRRPPFVKVHGEQLAKNANDTKGENPHPGPLAEARPANEGEGSRLRVEGKQRLLTSSATALDRAMGEFLNDVDLMGTTLPDYARKVSREVIHVGRAGTLIDWCAPESVSDGPNENRVYATLYQAEQILNWRMERIGGRNVLTLLVLAESVEVGDGQGQMADGKEDGDGNEAEVVEQVRVLRLSAAESTQQGAGSSYQCEVEIWRPVKKGKKDTISTRSRRDGSRWELVDRRVPLRRGKPLPLIPFVFHGPNHAGPEVDKLPLADIISVNLDHYRLHAEYRHGMHFTALPTAWVSGFDKNATLKIGSSAAWVTETVGAAAGFLEYTGQGLSTFERAMDRDEHAMAVLGARLLETQKRVGEAAEAIELKQSGENSILGTLAASVSMSLTNVLRWAHWWNSIEAMPEDIGKEQALVEINTDYSTRGLTATEITAVVSAWQNGALSRDSMMDIFRRGEVLPEGRTNEEEALLIQRSEGRGQRADVPAKNAKDAKDLQKETEETEKQTAGRSAEGAKPSIRYPRLKNEA